MNASYIMRAIKANLPSDEDPLLSEEVDRLYMVSDTGEVFREDSGMAAWETLVGVDENVGQASQRTLGAGSTVVAAGDHTHP